MTPTNTDAAREAAIEAAIKALSGYTLYQGRFGDTAARVAIPAALDAFLAKALEGADEKLAEIRELANACRTWAAENGGGNGFLSAEAAIGLDRAATLVTALSAKLKEVDRDYLVCGREAIRLGEELTRRDAQLTAQKAAHSKLLRDEAAIYAERFSESPPKLLRRLADKIEGGE